MTLLKAKRKAENMVKKNDDEIKEVIDLTPRTLDSLISLAKQIEDDSTDYTVENANSQNVRFNENAGLTFQTEKDGVLSLPISRYALGQLGTKIGVPSRYLEKCVRSGRIDLAQDNVNSWLEDFNKDLFIREYHGGIRGILSSRYSVCDTPEILEAVDDAVDLDNYRVKGSFLNAERLHVRLIGKEMLPIDGEDLFSGLFIDSSDVGRSILTVRFGIYKQVCTNGLTIAKAGGVLFEQKHIGISASEFHDGLVASLSKVDELSEHAVEWVKYAQSRSVHYDVNHLSKDDTEAFLNYIHNLTLLSKDSSQKVITLMQEKYDSSRWGFINSITEVAQDFTLEKRLDLERIAGNLLVA